jgi:hypothetical protein
MDAPPQGDSLAPLFNRGWKLAVPGAAWQSTNVAAGTVTTHVSAGSGQLPHIVTISPNGSYVWTNYGERVQGNWERSKDGQSLVLVNGYEGKNWNVAQQSPQRGGGILLWTGNSLAEQFRGR